jgi:hypothetical protein
MRERARHFAGLLLTAALFVPIAPGLVHADVIDGDWCKGTSHFTIEGPKILTPGGNRIEGRYSRHSFFYVVPANEPGAGGEIDMLLLNEENVQVTRKGQSSQPEVWQRCRPTS